MEGPRIEYDHIAPIRIPWHEFETRFGMKFTENDVRYEAPGPHAYATLRTPSGAVFLLDHYFDYPEPGVLLSGRVDEDLEAQRKGFAKALGLPDDAFAQVRRGDEWFDGASGARMT
jgi:hypothetical protein